MQAFLDAQMFTWVFTELDLQLWCPERQRTGNNKSKAVNSDKRHGQKLLYSLFTFTLKDADAVRVYLGADENRFTVVTEQLQKTSQTDGTALSFVTWKIISYFAV